jgi:fructokinase
MMAASDIVKVSDEDLAWLTGHDDLHRGAADLLSKGTKLICVTEGAEGVTGYSAVQTVRVPANKVAVVDTVGAGDTFNAGFLAALSDAGVLSKAEIANLEADTIEAALSLGARAAAVTVSRAGANPPTRAELG